MAGAAAILPWISAAASAVTLVKGLSGSDKQSAPAAAPAPAVTAPTKVPVPEDSGKAAQKASIAEQMRRRGRASTILTDTAGDTLGV